MSDEVKTLTCPDCRVVGRLHCESPYCKWLWCDTSAEECKVVAFDFRVEPDVTRRAVRRIGNQYI